MHLVDMLTPHAPSPVLLSAREEQVLRLLAWGFGNKEIAARLRLSVKTVETYKTRSLEKLRLRSRVDLVRHALRAGWLTTDAEPPPATCVQAEPPALAD